MFKTTQKFRVISQFFIPYLLLLLLFSTASVFVYEKIYSIVEADATDQAISSLTQTMELVDRRFKEIQSISMQIIGDEKVQSFRYIKRPFFNKNAYKVYEISNSLYDYSLINHFILNYYILYNNNEIVLSSNTAYTYKQFYDLKFRYKGMEYSEWVDELASFNKTKHYIPYRDIFHNNESFSAITYIQPLGGYTNDAHIMFILNNNEIETMLNTINVHEESYSYILDNNDQIISFSGLDPSNSTIIYPQSSISELITEQHEMLVTQITSPSNGWRYISVQPKEVVLEKVMLIKRIYVILFSFLLLTGLFATIYFSYVNSKGLLNILGVMRKNRIVVDEDNSLFTMKHVSFMLTNIIYRNELLEDLLADQLPSLKSHFLNRLVFGQFLHANELLISMKHVNITWDKEYKCIAIIQITGYDDIDDSLFKELTLVKAQIKLLLKQNDELDIIFHDMNESQLALFINANADTIEHFNAITYHATFQLAQAVRENSHTKLHITIGQAYKKIAEYSLSYREAEKLIQLHKWHDDEPVVQYSAFENNKSPISYYYPADLEQRLQMLINSGNTHETEQILQQIVNENLFKTKLPIMYRRVLYTELIGTLLKCIEATTLTSEYMTSYTQKVNTLLEVKQLSDESFTDLTRIFVSLAEYFQNRKKSSNVQLKQKLISFIDENYAQEDISLTMLANTFDQSEAYLSFFMKEQTGINFSDYVIQKRMNEAKRLLTETNLPVQTIAAKVGYLSLNSFSRAFKRLLGISATDYRKQYS